VLSALSVRYLDRTQPANSIGATGLKSRAKDGGVRLEPPAAREECYQEGQMVSRIVVGVIESQRIAEDVRNRLKTEGCRPATLSSKF
jgi:hypothetical protein